MLRVALNAGDYHYAIVVIKWWASRSASFRWPTFWRLVNSEWWLCAKVRVRNDEFGQAVRWGRGRGRGGSQDSFQLDEQQQRAQQDWQAAKRTWWRRGCRQGGLQAGGEAVDGSVWDTCGRVSVGHLWTGQCVDGSVCDTCGLVSVWHVWTGQCGTLVDGSVWDTYGTFPNPLSVHCMTFWTLCPCGVTLLNSVSLRCDLFWTLCFCAVWPFWTLCPRAVLTFSNSLSLDCVDHF